MEKNKYKLNRFFSFPEKKKYLADQDTIFLI